MPDEAVKRVSVKNIIFKAPLLICGINALKLLTVDIMAKAENFFFFSLAYGKLEAEFIHESRQKRFHILRGFVSGCGSLHSIFFPFRRLSVEGFSILEKVNALLILMGFPRW